LDERCLQAREQVHHHLNKTQELYQKNLNKEAKYYLNLEPGDKVLLENPGTSVKGKVKKYNGPFLSDKEILIQPSTKLKIPKTGRWQIVESKPPEEI